MPGTCRAHKKVRFVIMDGEPGGKSIYTSNASGHLDWVCAYGERREELGKTMRGKEEDTRKQGRENSDVIGR